MPFAIIETGGKQYLVSPKDIIKVEKLSVPGNELVFNRVLLVSDNDLKIGNPFVSGAKVQAKILGQGRNKKIKILKYHSKTRYRRRIGHRQEFTEVEIISI